MSSDLALPATTKKNIETIAHVEWQLLDQRSWVERVGEAIARFFGSLHFITAHMTFLAAWFLWNAGVISWLSPRDP